MRCRVATHAMDSSACARRGPWPGLFFSLESDAISHRDGHARPPRAQASRDGKRRGANRAQRVRVGHAGPRQESALRMDPRTRVLIEAPIARTLLRLAVPNILVLGAQASAGLVETYFIGKLGTDSLAGVALVFPVLMLMQMMSAGALGGGISSAIARALGGSRRADANALVLHAVIIALAFGLAFMLAVLGGGRWLYGVMGGSGASLTAALTYSNVVFSGAILIWVFNSLASVIRGTGNMAFPAVVTVVGAAVLIP